jgi:DNA polymerase-3 subunit beta
MPVLENFLFEIKGGELRVTATDLEIALISTLNVTSDIDTRIVIPARLLYDIIRSLDDLMLHFHIEKTAKLKIKTDNGVYNLSYSSPDDFPAIPSAAKDKEIILSGEYLKKAIDQTSFAMSREDMRPAMTGTLLEFSDEGIRFVATDGHRLVKFVNKKFKSDSLEQYIIPERAITVLSKILSPSDVKIHLSKSNISFILDEVQFITRLINEKYPAYSSVIPLENENQLRLKRSELHAAIKRMMLFSSGNSKQVKFSLGTNSTEVSAEDIDHGSNAREEIASQYNGDAMDIGFNTAYINDILSHVGSEEIVFKLHSPTKACIIEPSTVEENEDLMLLLMPVRLNN